jgi:hypothetical protein
MFRTFLLGLTAAVLMAGLSGCAEFDAGYKAFLGEAETDRINIAKDRLITEIGGLCRTTYIDLITQAPSTPGLAVAVPALCGHLAQAPATGILGEPISKP